MSFILSSSWVWSEIFLSSRQLFQGYKAPVASRDKEEEEEEEWDDERMKGVDKKLAKLILNEIMDKGSFLKWV